MIEHELLFLGLLLEGPKHGYEIKRLIEEELSAFVGLKVKSIYYPLKRMEQMGLIKKDVACEGKGPEKYTYRLTAKGNKNFDKLITESFLSIERPYFNIDLSLYFLQYVEKKTAKRQLRGRILFLKRIKRNLNNLRKKLPPKRQHLPIILDHDIDLVEAEINSITRLMEILK